MRKLLRDALCVVLSLSMALMGTGCSGMRTGAQEAYAIDDESITADSLDLSGNVKPATLEYGSLSDEDLLRHIEDAAYERAVAELDSDEFLVEQVEAVYISQEYVDTLAFNSQTNKYFGYTIAELEEQFQGQRYVFTVDESGKTIVTAFEDYDDTFDKVIQNVAVGTGVILVCVTISAVTAGAGAPAASMIFAVAAKSGTVAALSGAAIGGASSAVFTGMQTGSVEETLKAAELGASEGYKMGAITGAITGAAGETIALKNATANGLTMNQAATIQKESKYPLDVIKQMHSMDEYQVYKDAGLSTKMVNGKTALVKDIDLDFKVMLKELQALALDVRVLREDGSEVEIHEDLDDGSGEYSGQDEDYGRRYSKSELANSGYTQQEVGSEGFGMSRLLKDKCDFLLSLPMAGKVNSLNASVAAGIFMYEIVRQRKK